MKHENLPFSTFAVLAFAALAGYTNPASAINASGAVARPYHSVVDTEQLLDEAGRLLRSGQLERAHQLLSELSTADIPSDLIELAAWRSRDLGDVALAGHYYSLGARNFPERSVFAAGQLLILSYGGKVDEGNTYIAKWDVRHHDRRDWLEAKAYFYENSGQTLAAQRSYQTLVELDPLNPSFYRNWVFSIALSGAPQLAIAKAQAKPSAFSASDWHELYRTRAVMAIRWSELPFASQSEGDRRKDEAIQYVKEYIQLLESASSSETAALNRAKADLIIAYVNRRKMSEAIAEFERLDQETDQLPVFLLTAAGKAYLADQQPRRAVTLLELALKQQPDDHQAMLTLFYAYHEAGQYEQSLNIALSNAERHPEWRRRSIDQMPQENYSRLEADHQIALYPGYSNQLKRGQRSLESMLRQAPFNQQLRADLATVYRGRGWNNKAEQQYDLIAAVTSDLPALTEGRMFTALALQEYQEAEEQLKIYRQRYAETEELKKQERYWGLHNNWEFIGFAGRQRNTGTTFGKHQTNFETFLYTPPMKYNYRAYLHTYYALADYPEGDGELNRVGIGGDYRVRRFDLRGELTAGLDGQSDPGITLDGNYRWGDHWQLSGNYQSYSLLTPLRAVLDDVEAQSLEAAVNYAWHESRELTGSVTAVDFSDGNLRQIVNAIFRQTVWVNEKHRLELRPVLYASKNSDLDVIYYNPSRDASLSLSAEYEGLLKQRYDNSFRQVVTLGGGAYYQDEFGTSPIWNVQYEHRWQHGLGLGWNYGLNYGRRVYDGNEEDHIALYAGLNARF